MRAVFDFHDLNQLGVPIQRVVTDSRKVQPGDVFLACRGEYLDGRNFIAQAQQPNTGNARRQLATQAIGHVTLHARAQQFASRVTGRLFTLGMQYWQLGDSHYWGHNAILRTRAFASCAGLPPPAGASGSPEPPSRSFSH